MENSTRDKAPGVFRILETSNDLSKETRELCISELSNLLNEGVLDYRSLPRESGVSFNPLPARLLEILIRESKIYAKDSLLAALSLSKKDLIDVENTQVDEVDSHALLAWYLDIVRHLKRSSLSKEEKEKVSTTITVHTEEKIEVDKKLRLYLLVENALRRYTFKSRRN